MQSHSKKTCVFLSNFIMIVTLLLSYAVVLPAQADSAAPVDSGIKLGIYKSGNGIINAYGEKMYVQYTSYFLEQYRKLPPPVNLSASNASYHREQSAAPAPQEESLNSAEGYCGQGYAPYNEAYEIRDIIDGLPMMPADVNASDPFFLLANEVSYRKEQGLPITSDSLVKTCSEDFNPLTGGMAYNLAYLNYKDNWLKILQAYQARYTSDYPAIEDALNKLKNQATEYAKANNMPIGVTGELYEAPASILDNPEYEKHYVLMPQQQWRDTTFSDDYVDNDINDPQKWLDAIHLAFDIGGLVPVIGAPLDGLNAIMYYIEGDKVNALLSAGAIAPFVGEGLTAAKLTARGVKYADKLVDVDKLLKRVDGFETFSALKKALRPLPKGEAWHHIVEQCQIIKSGFLTKQIQNIENVIAVESGFKGSIHSKISGIYKAQYDDSGRSLRDWLAGKSYEEQFEWGISELRRLGDVIKNPDGGWIFKPFK